MSVIRLPRRRRWLAPPETTCSPMHSRRCEASDGSPAQSGTVSRAVIDALADAVLDRARARGTEPPTLAACGVIRAPDDSRGLRCSIGRWRRSSTCSRRSRRVRRCISAGRSAQTSCCGSRCCLTGMDMTSTSTESPMLARTSGSGFAIICGRARLVDVVRADLRDHRTHHERRGSVEALVGARGARASARRVVAALTTRPLHARAAARRWQGRI